MSHPISAAISRTPQFSLSQAIAELERRHALGESDICEVILRDHPDLLQNRDAVLELIYLEFVLCQEANRPISAQTLHLRFPEYQADLQKILSVDHVFRQQADTSVPTATTLHSELNDNHFKRQNLGVPLDHLGDYELLEVIGQGGMGVVYKARQHKLNRLVAVKTIDALSSLNPAAVARFQNEAELVAKLQHPHIVQVYEVGSILGVPYFSMELVSDGTLAQATQERPLVPVVAAKIVETLARAVHYAHTQSVVHRDLKPANILLSASDRVQAIDIPAITQLATLDSQPVSGYEPKIADFGLGKFLEGAIDRTATQGMIGTPSFMAPEQIDPELGTVGPACDIYSLGAILYDAMTGTPPFNAATVIETIQKVRTSEVIQPSKLQSKIPRDLETICLKCLRKEPVKRYQTANELADDLQRFLTGKPILARPAGVIERNWKWARRHPSLAALFAAVMIASIGMTFLWLRSEHSRRGEHEALQRNDRLLYDRDIALSQFEFQSNRLERSREILEKTRPEYRGWEWDYLNQQNSRAIWESPKLRNQAVEADISGDGQFVAAASQREGDFEPDAIYVWNVKRNETVWKLQERDSNFNKILSLNFSPDGAWLVSAGYGTNGTKGGAKLWDLSRGTLKHTLTETDARVCRFSRDGNSIFVGDARGLVTQHSTETGKLLRKYPCVDKGISRILDFDFSPDGSRMVVLPRTHDVSLWDTISGKRLQTLVREGKPYKVSWSPDGKALTIFNWSGYTRCYRFEADRLTRVSENATTREDERSLVDYRIGMYSPSGRRFVSTEFGHSVEIENIASKRIEQVLPSHNGHTQRIAFDATGRYLLTAGIDSRVRVWDLALASRRQVHSGFAETRVSDFAISPTNREMAMAYNRTRDSKLRVEILDTESHKVIRQLTGHTKNATCVAYSTDGDQLLSGSDDTTVRIWNPATGENLAVLEGHKAPILKAAFSADTQSVASVDKDGQIIVWKLADKSIARTWKFEGVVQSVAFHPLLPVMAVASHGKPVSFWGLDGKQLSQLPIDDECTSVCFSPNGGRLATVGTQPTAMVWRTEEMSRPGFEHCLICELKGHTDAINNVSFSPDGLRLVSSCRDQDFRLYDVESGYELIKLQSGRGTNGLIHLSPDGKLIVRTLTGIVSTWSNEDLSALQPPSSSQATDIAWHQAEAAAAVKQQDWFAAQFHLNHLTQLEPDSIAHFQARANARMQLGDFAGAEMDLRYCDGKLDEPEKRKSLADLARACLGQQKWSEYRDVCERLFHEYAESTDPLDLNICLWYCSLDARQRFDTDKVKLKLERLLVNPKIRNAAYFNTIALYHYRMQEYHDAIRNANVSMKLLKNASSPHDWMIIAASYAQLDQQRLGWLPLFIRQKIRQWGFSSRWNYSLDFVVRVDAWMKELDENIKAQKTVAKEDNLLQRIELPLLKKEWEEIVDDK